MPGGKETPVTPARCKMYLLKNSTTIELNDIKGRGVTFEGFKY